MKCQACGYDTEKVKEENPNSYIEEFEEFENIRATQKEGNYYRYDASVSFSLFRCPKCNTARFG